VKDIDRTGDSMWDPKFVGEAIMDDSFKPYTRETQLFFKSLCKDMRKQTFIIESSVDCWFEHFEEYLN
jgi:hypothetical protein